jgi:uncharacterized membrane protein
MQLLSPGDVDPERAWLGSLVAGVVIIIGAVVAFPRTVYDGFLWRYFWGPVHADAAAASCAVRSPGGGTELLYNSDACASRIAEGAIVGEPGYTLVSTLGYMVVLVYMLVGVYFLLKRLDLRPYSEFFFALVPFMLFGGALRVVEDATDAAIGAGVEPAITYPLNTLLISPVIYWTAFLLTLGGLLIAKQLQNRGVSRTYHYPLGAIGVMAVLATVAHLTNLAVTREYVAFHPGVLITVMVLAVVIAVGIYLGFERYKPRVNAGTGLVGLVVVWGHAVDGVANVLASDWTYAFGIDLVYGSKHVFNRFIVNLTGQVQPAWLTAAVGDSWPFLVVKVLVAAGIVALFDEEFIAESPRYSIMLLTAIVAVGLGPGTRDVLRVTFGI